MTYYEFKINDAVANDMAAAIVTDGLCKMTIFLDGVSNHNFSLRELGYQFPRNIFFLNKEGDDLL